MHMFSVVSLEIIASCILTSVYLVVLCGVASPSYLYRDDVKLGIFFYLLIEITLMLAETFIEGTRDNDKNREYTRHMALVIPLVCFIVTSQTLNYCKSYADFSMTNMSYEDELRVGKDIIEQFITADNLGQTKMDLHVVSNENADDNWPYPSYAGNLIGDTLFRHGVISRKMDVVTVFDSSKNEELMIY